MNILLYIFCISLNNPNKKINKKKIEKVFSNNRWMYGCCSLSFFEASVKKIFHFFLFFFFAFRFLIAIKREQKFETIKGNSLPSPSSNGNIFAGLSGCNSLSFSLLFHTSPASRTITTRSIMR